VKCWGGAFGVTPVAVANLGGVIHITSLSQGADAAFADFYYVATTNTGTAFYWAPGASPSATDYVLTGLKEYGVSYWSCWGFDGWGTISLNLDGTADGGTGLVTIAGVTATDIVGISLAPGLSNISPAVVRSNGNTRWVDTGGFQGGALTDIYNYAGGAVNNARKTVHYNAGSPSSYVLTATGNVIYTSPRATHATNSVDITVTEGDYCYAATVPTTCIAKSDGSVECLDGTYGATPVAITGLSNIVGLSNGSQYGKIVAVGSDHKIWEWAPGATVATEKTGF
jgi:hypothetical protein